MFPFDRLCFFPVFSSLLSRNSFTFGICSPSNKNLGSPLTSRLQGPRQPPTNLRNASQTRGVDPQSSDSFFFFVDSAAQVFPVDVPFSEVFAFLEGLVDPLFLPRTVHSSRRCRSALSLLKEIFQFAGPNRSRSEVSFLGFREPCLRIAIFFPLVRNFSLSSLEDPLSPFSA